MLGALQKFFQRWSTPVELRPGQSLAADGENQGTTPPHRLCGIDVDDINKPPAIQNNVQSTYLAVRQMSTVTCERERIEPSCSLHGLLNMPTELEAAIKEFLRVHGDDYGYDGQLDSIRYTEFRRLAGEAYLDYAGAALYSEGQIRACSEELLNTLLCNPHSAPASASADAMAALRRSTLEMLNADGRQYEVVITSGATSALKMVAECFPWRSGTSCLAHPVAVHNSVLGMRGPALEAGAAVQLIQVVAPSSSPVVCGNGSGIASCGKRWGSATMPTVGDAAAAFIKPAPLSRVVAIGAPMTASSGAAYRVPDAAGMAVGPTPTWNLLVLPAECNFTGDREPLDEVVQHVQQYGIAIATPSKMHDAVWRDGGSGGGGGGGGGRWLVLLDAAKACATAPPDLSAVPADFVVLSYYKIFGHPTGLGALVARKEAMTLLAAGKSYFGGGTVEVAVADRPYHVRRGGAPGLEDGTPPFTSIAAARHGFAFLSRLGGLYAVNRHSCCLARWLATRLAALRHGNGAPVAVLYGNWCASAAAARSTRALPDHGPTLSFNLLRADGSWVGYAEVARLAAMHGLHLRTGCFCNPGACAQWLGLSTEDIINHHKGGHVCWDDQDLIDGRPTGAVRVSLGAASTFTDVYAVLQLIRKYFVDGGGRTGASVFTAPREVNATQPAPLLPTAISKGLLASAFAGGTAREDEHANQRQSFRQVTIPVAGSTTRASSVGLATQMHKQSLPQAAHSPPVRESLSPRQPDTSPVQPEAVLLLPSQLGCGDSSISAIASSSGCGEGASSSVFPSRDSGGRGGDGEILIQGRAPTGRLSRILVYPVKSCAAQEVVAWPIGPTGLLYDREWALVDDSGKVITLKQCPRMALVRPFVDLTQGTLTIHGPKDADADPLELAIPGLFNRRHPGNADTAPDTNRSAIAGEVGGNNSVLTAVGAVAVSGTMTKDINVVVRQRGSVRLDAGLTLERVQVCGNTVCSDLVDVCHDAEGDARVRKWFARVLGAPCRIVQQRAGARKVRRPAGQGSAPPLSPSSSSPPPQGFVHQEERRLEGYGKGEDRSEHASGGMKAADEPSVGFANDGQYLLISEASLGDLRARLQQTSAIEIRARTTASSSNSGSGGVGRGGSEGGLAEEGDDDLVARLRPNLVVSGFLPYEEDGWAAVTVGQLHADVLGTCPRCELLQVDPRVGVRRGSEVLLTLAQYRRRGGRVQFGVLLAAAPGSTGASPGMVGEEAGMGGSSKVVDGNCGCAVAEQVDGLPRPLSQFKVVAVGNQVLPTATGPARWAPAVA